MIIDSTDRVLVTGSTGFLGSRVVASLLDHGFRNIRCLARPSSSLDGIEKARAERKDAASVEVVRGNLLSPGECERVTKDVAVIYHLAAGTGDKSFPDAFKNSVVTTRNLLDGALRWGGLRRFVNVSSFAVYTNRDKARRNILDESCPVEKHAHLRGEAYCYAKAKQDELVIEYGRQHGIPYVLVRPGAVYGPGMKGITRRVGSTAFGIFLHLGGSNVIPLTYVDNCADAIVLAGVTNGINGEVLNVVDDDLPTSRQFLRLYQRNARRLLAIPVPPIASYILCALGERYNVWSGGASPLILNRRAWHAYWKGSRYTNEKAKRMLRWRPRVSTSEGLRRYFASCRGEAVILPEVSERLEDKSHTSTVGS